MTRLVCRLGILPGGDWLTGARGQEDRRSFCCQTNPRGDAEAGTRQELHDGALASCMDISRACVKV